MEEQRCGVPRAGRGGVNVPEPHLPVDKAYIHLGINPKIMHPQGFSSHASLPGHFVLENLFSYNCLMIIHLTTAWMRNGIIQFYTSNLKA